MRSLLGIDDLDTGEIEVLVKQSVDYAEMPASRIEPVAGLGGSAVGLAFFEPSTRTSLSFELAVHRLGGVPLVHRSEGSSEQKGETTADSIRTLAALGAGMLVIRHPEAGLPGEAQDWTGLPVVNAGDGPNQHPTQALLDVVTLTRHFGGVTGLEVAIVGDIAHSRVANSLLGCLPRLGAGVVLVGPPSLLPEETPAGVGVISDLDAVLGEVDVVYMLRVQRERGATTSTDYIERFQLDAERAARLGDAAVVMHPGPLNRGVEITDEVADGDRSLILDQVANGVPTRMAVLSWVGGSWA